MMFSHDATSSLPSVESARFEVRTSLVVWFSLLPIGLLLLLVVPGMLPWPYPKDAQLMRELITGEFRPVEFVVGQPYANTVYLYILSGVGADPIGGAYLTYLAAWTSVLVALWLSPSGGRLWLWFPAFAFHLLLVIFTCMHSKELHAMPVLALLLVLCGKRFAPARVLAMAAVVVAYAVYFRTYWAIAAVLAFTFILVRRRVDGPWRMAFAIAGVYMLLLVAYHLATDTYLTDFRTLLWTNRDIDQFSDSAFPNLFANDNVAFDILNAFFALFRLLLPFALLPTGKPQHLVFIVWELATLAAFVVVFRRVWRVPALDARTEFAAAWILAFTMTQALFEPDYGTFLRHQTALLPAFALLTLNALWPARATGQSRPPEASAAGPADQRCAPA